MRTTSMILLWLALLVWGPAQAQTDYAAPGTHAVTTRLDVWHDAARQRSVPLKLYLPAGGATALIVFSHGLGGSREGGRAWGEHWASHGLLCLHLQHAGSDEAIWRGSARGGLRNAFSPQQLVDRVQDVRFVLDEVERRRARGEAPFDRIDPAHIGMAGHSFGAITAEALAGERQAMRDPESAQLVEPRIRAFVAFSPSARDSGATLEARFASIPRPFFSVTGSNDTLPLGGGQKAENRTLPYEYMPAPDKYLLVFDGADHMVFNGHLVGPPGTRTQTGGLRSRRITGNDARVTRLSRAATTAFWLAQFGAPQQAADADAWLKDGGLQRSLGAGDRYAFK